MNYIIFDMEWNQPLYPKMTVTEPVLLHAEIVQIGAVKLNDDFNVIDTFGVLISPKYYKKMHKKVQTLTKITTEELKNGLPFPEAFERFINWCGDEFSFLTWGHDDIPVLRDNLTLHSLDAYSIPDAYNLQVIFDAQVTHEHKQTSLGKALDLLGETGSDAHNALNDAGNTAIVCSHLDMFSGIENYEELKAQFLVTDADDNNVCGSEYDSKREIFRDNEVTEFECPVCKKRAVCCDFVRQNAGKTLAVAHCESGDELFVRFKISRHSDGKYRVKRAAFLMNAEYKEFYKERKELNKAFNRTRRKKSVAT